MAGVSDIRRKRNDLSPFFFHFTKGNDAKERLSSIINDNKLISSTNYNCFTEAPLSSMISLLDYFEGFPRPMYSKYAIGFNRHILIHKYNIQPVIYGLPSDKRLISPDLHWKFLETDMQNDKEFMWLREWRIKGDVFDFTDFPKEEIIIIAPTESDLRDLIADEDYEVEFIYWHEIRSSTPYLIDKTTRKMKGFSIENLKKEFIKESFNDYILSGMTLSQTIGGLY